MHKKLNQQSLTHIFILCLLNFTYSCGNKSTTINSPVTQSTSPSTTTSPTNGTTSTTSTSTSTVGCDGIARTNASVCYYKNLPELTFNGPGTYGTTLWSSSTDLTGMGISPTQFTTDATFSVRMKPSYITDGRVSKQGRNCSKYMGTNFTKMRLFVMLRKNNTSLGEVATLDATYSGTTWNFSNTWRYTVPRGTLDPYVLEIVGLQTNDRCTGYYGTAPTGCSYMDIPLATGTNPTECVGVTLQMATDDTYDLPN